MSGLTVADVVVSSGRVTILDDASFTAPAGRVTALLGPNGAGKSTLLRAIAAIQLPHRGSVHLDGVDLHALGRRARARLVALVEQDATTELPLTARAVVALGRSPHEALLGGGSTTRAEVDDALAAAGAAAFADREFPTLSGGERQRVLIARALAQEPRLLLLDEPTNHLDVGAQLETLGLLRRLAQDDGVTVVAALHDLGLAAAHADAVVVLAGGRVVANGATAEVLTPDLIRDVYGVDAAWTTNPLTGGRLLAVAPAR